MHKFFVPVENIKENMAVIEGDDVKHIYKVLRLEDGDTVCINDCIGAEYIGEITEINKKEVLVKIIKRIEINNESPIDIYLFQGLPKSQKMDLIVQKATELGVKEITPVITERVVVKNEIGEYRKMDRWNRIALEACKQSKRTMIPRVNSPVEFSYMLDLMNSMDLIIVPYENEEQKGLKSVMGKIEKSSIKSVAIVIGPEGGFEEAEITALKNSKGEIITLGPRILRTETAGFVAASLIMYELGDLGGI
ncbi:MAG: 16S rRNA (uracil(1498)-N(3))-methyltransferase [Solirubrobacterales bacterium]